METINVSKDKLGKVLTDFESLIDNFESLLEEQDEIAKKRINDIKQNNIVGKSENELNNYLKKRGVKIE